MPTSFKNLATLQKRCKKHAVGLPLKVEVVADWVGIGFSVNSVRCVARMTEVTEILPVPETIRVPGVKKWVMGLANIRGGLMPILDLRGFLIGEDSKINKKSRILVVNLSGVLAGLLVEEVFGLRRFKESDKKIYKKSRTSPEMKGMRMKRYVVGQFADKSEYWNIFSIKALLTTEKFLRVV